MWNLRTFKLYNNDLWGTLILSSTLTHPLKHLLRVRYKTRYHYKSTYESNIKHRLKRIVKFKFFNNFFKKYKKGYYSVKHSSRNLDKISSTLRVMKYGRLSALNRKLRFKKRKFVNFKKSYKMWRRIATLFRNRYQFSRNNYRFSSKPRNKFLVDYTKPKNYEKLKARVKRRTFNSQRIINFRKFRKFYSTLTVQQFKRLVSFVNFSSKRGSLVNNFITFIESRLDVMLFRSGLVTSLFMSKHFIIHKHILVNNVVSCFPNRNLNLLDLISFNTLSFNSVLQNVKLNYVKRWLNYIKSGKKKRQKRKVNLMLLNLPSYIEVDFKAFSFILIADIFRKNVFYPFKISNQELSVFLNRIKTKVN